MRGGGESPSPQHKRVGMDAPRSVRGIRGVPSRDDQESPKILHTNTRVRYIDGKPGKAKQLTTQDKGEPPLDAIGPDRPDDDGRGCCISESGKGDSKTTWFEPAYLQLRKAEQ